jgi:hypothetical protein
VRLVTIEPPITASILYQNLLGGTQEQEAKKTIEMLISACAQKGLPVDMIRPILSELINGLYANGHFLCDGSKVVNTVKSLGGSGIHMAWWENSKPASDLIAHIKNIQSRQSVTVGNPMQDQRQTVASDAPPSATM